MTSAPADSIIYVCAGTYNESVTVNEPLALDGAEFGVSAVGRTGEPETVVSGTGGIKFTAGASGDAVSGFTINGYTGGVGAIQAANVGSGWTFSDNIVDASEGGIYFNTNDVASPAATTISDNAFSQSTPLPRAEAVTRARPFSSGARPETTSRSPATTSPTFLAPVPPSTPRDLVQVPTTTAATTPPRR